MNGTTGSARVAVVGVGGAGCNVVSHVHRSGLPVSTIAINTDREGLRGTAADVKLHICRDVVKGEGARGDAVVGKRCADIHVEEIREALAGFDAVIVVAGLGGGTGTGAMPVVVDAALSQGAEVRAIGISPFAFEGRKDAARAGWAHVRAICERTLLVDNDKVLKVMPGLGVEEALLEVNRTIGAHIASVAGSLCPRAETEGDAACAVEALYPLEALVA